MKKKKLIMYPAVLILSSFVLTSCGSKKINVGEGFTEIVKYHGDDNNYTITGKVSFDNLDNIKILTFEKSGIEMTRLVAHSIQYYLGSTRGGGAPYDLHSYVDILSNTDLITYKDYNTNKKVYIAGEDIKIINDEPITSYVLKEVGIKNKYDIQELINVYKDSITLSDNKVKTK